MQVLLGCSKVYIVNRDVKEVTRVLSAFKQVEFSTSCSYIGTPDEALALEPPVLIVSTIPDFSPQSNEERRARAVISSIMNMSPQAMFLDMCYHPFAETELKSLARQSNLCVVSGIEAFFHQAVASNSLWTGLATTELPLEGARTVIDVSRAHMQFRSGNKAAGTHESFVRHAHGCVL